MDRAKVAVNGTEHGYSPPEWVKRANARDAPMLLEHRLAHFIEWLEERQVTFAGKENRTPLSSNQIHALVEEYVNS